MQGMREGQGVGREWGRGREEKEKRERERRKRKVQRGRMEPGAGRLVRATDGDRGSGKVCVEEGKLALKRKDVRRSSPISMYTSTAASEPRFLPTTV